MTQPNPINVAGLDHVVFRVADLDGMIAFYTQVLGCRLERFVEQFRLAQLRAGDALIDLIDVGDAPSVDGASPNVDHVCLKVRPWNEDAIVAHLGAHGVSVDEVGTRYGSAGFGPSIYIQDPEGNTVELKG